MPFSIRKSGDAWQVVNADTGKVYGTHPSHAKAIAQQRALYANVPDAKEGDMSKKKVAESGIYTVSLGEEERAADHQTGDWDADLDENKQEHPTGDWDVDLDEAKYDASVGDENFAYAPSGEPPSARKFKIGDPQHVKIAVSAFVNWSYRGNAPDIPSSAKPGIKRKIAAAISKHLSGDEAKYYSKWLSTGKKPDSKTAEMRNPPVGTRVMHEMYIVAPRYSMGDEPDFPDVPVAPGVDMAQLLAGDPDPVFITRPLAILDEVSENGLPYNQAVFDDVLRQVNTKRPVARRGHVSEADKSSVFPPDDGYWIGAVSDSSFYGKPTVFGKCYVPPGSMREMVLRRRATGTGLSNSLWGDLMTGQDAQGNTVPLGVELESIDFVPEERAALQALGGEFVVTSEMSKGVNEMAGTHEEALREAMATLKPEELHDMLSEAQTHHVAETHMREAKCAECREEGKVYEMLHESHRKAVAEAYLKEMAPQAIYEMLSKESRGHIAEAHAKEEGKTLAEAGAQRVKEETMAEMKSMKQSLAEMDKRVKFYERQDFERKLDAKIETFFAGYHTPVTPKGIEGMATLKKRIRTDCLAEMAGMKDGQIEENIDPAADKVWGEDKPLVEMFIAGASGPAAIVGGQRGQSTPAGWDPVTQRYSDDYVAQAVRNTGALGGRSGGFNRDKGGN